MFFDSGAGLAQPDALDEVLAVTEDLDAIMAVRYGAIDRMRGAAFAGEETATGTRREILLRSVRLELAAALRITEHAAEVLLTTAEALVHRYPDALIALGQGLITDQHAKVMVGRLAVLSDELRQSLASRALDLAQRYAVGPFRRKLDALIDAEQQPTAEERHEQALAERRVDLIPQPDGMATLEVYGPAVELHAAFERATAAAKVLGDVEGESRTRDQLRADVICDLLIDGDTAAHPAAARGIKATVVVTVPALSLLDGENDGGSNPPVVEGVGPISLSRARELCGGASDWMRILTHPENGMVLSVGREQYRPPAALRRLVKWRSERCMAPGCSVPASRCEIDHNIAWIDGGPTSLENLTPFCKGHHTIKHHGDWSVKQIPDSGGVIEWISPTGRRYLVEPERRVPVFTPAPF